MDHLSLISQNLTLKYMCIGKDFYFIPLIFAVGPRNIQCDEDVKAREGDRVVFRCKFSANPAPEALTWTVRDRDDLITVETDGQEVDGQYTASLNVSYIFIFMLYHILLFIRIFQQDLQSYAE